MNCAFCNREAPKDMDDVVQEGWIPDYFEGQDQMEGPVCPDCVDQHLWLSTDGEYEMRIPKATAHRYN
jgi:hypothetical protein